MKEKFLLIYLILLPLILILGGCSEKPKSELTISVSILPQKQWIDILTDSTLNVNTIIPPGSNPVTYNPTPAQMQLLDRSKLYFYIDGLGFENNWLPKFRDLNPKLLFYNSTQGIDRLEETHHHDHDDAEHHESSDPHLWVSPKRAILMVKNMYSVLLEENIIDSTLTKQNYFFLQNALTKLDSLYTDAAEHSKNKTIVIYHPALSYIAHDYGFSQISIEKDGKEPTGKHIKELVDSMRVKNIKYIFIQKQFDKKNASLIAKETNAELIEIDPLGYDYLHEAEILAEKLKKL